MDRRKFLSALAVGSTTLAGCSASDDRSTATASPTRPSPSETPTPSPSEGGTFRLTNLDVPDRLELNQGYAVRFTVRNTERRPREFVTTLSGRTDDTGWRAFDKRIREDVPGGETRTMQLRMPSLPFLRTYHYRLDALDATWSVEGVPKTLDFGIAYYGPDGVHIRPQQPTLSETTDATNATADSSGDRSMTFAVEFRNTANEAKQIPSLQRFSLHRDGTAHDPQVGDDSRTELAPGSRRELELPFRVPAGTDEGSVELRFSKDYSRGRVAVRWDK